MDFEWTSEDAAFRAELREFLGRRVAAPLVRTSFPGRSIRRRSTFEICGKLGRAWSSHPRTGPSSTVAASASGWQFIILGEELWRVGEHAAPKYMNVNWIGPALMLAGSEQQRGLPSSAGSAAATCFRGAKGSPSHLPAYRSGRADHDGRTGQRRVHHQQEQEEVVDFLRPEGRDTASFLTRTDPTSSGSAGITIFLVETAATPGLRPDQRSFRVCSVFMSSICVTFPRRPRPRLGSHWAKSTKGWDIVRLSSSATSGSAAPATARAGVRPPTTRTGRRSAAVTAGRSAPCRTAIHRGAGRLPGAARVLVHQAIDLRVKEACPSPGPWRWPGLRSSAPSAPSPSWSWNSMKATVSVRHSIGNAS